MRTQIPCSDYVETKGVIFFARMLDKIRLHAKGLLPPDYNRGFSPPDCLDARFCRYWEVDYDELVKKTLAAGGTDDEILDWCFQGRRPSDERILFWNTFITTRGWRDESSAELQQVKEANGLANRDDIQTWVDFHDVDEGRQPKFT